MKTALEEAGEDVRHYYDLWKAAEAREARLRERLKPAEPPYLPCLWHEHFDDTCPFCLRHRLATLEAAARDFLAAWDDDDGASIETCDAAIALKELLDGEG